jgi:hypothetical protein
MEQPMEQPMGQPTEQPMEQPMASLKSMAQQMARLTDSDGNDKGRLPRMATLKARLTRMAQKMAY